jgi:DNA-binding protein YbaB
MYTPGGVCSSCYCPECEKLKKENSVLHKTVETLSDLLVKSMAVATGEIDEETRDALIADANRILKGRGGRDT